MVLEQHILIREDNRITVENQNQFLVVIDWKPFIRKSKLSNEKKLLLILALS